MLEMSALDYAMVKIARLEKEQRTYELRLSALRCKLTEVLNEKRIIIVGRDSDEA